MARSPSLEMALSINSRVSVSLRSAIQATRLLTIACVNVHTRDGYRDLCILRSLYNTGARASELCGIRLPDLDLKNNQVLLYGKGKRIRTVPLWDSTVIFLNNYLKSERRVPQETYSNFLFINQHGCCLTRSGLYALCKKYLAKARVRVPTLAHKKVHPVHVWRRTTASHLLLAGVDLTVIQEWLGYLSIDNTCGYKGISIETKREVLQKFHLFEKSWQKTKPEGIDWSLHPKYSVVSGIALNHLPGTRIIVSSAR